MFKNRKKMLMAATAIVVGLAFNSTAQAHDPEQQMPGAPVLETLKGIEAAMLALDVNQHFCEKNEGASAALEDELSALMAEASAAYSQHTTMKATLKKIVTEGYGGDAGQFEDSAYLKAFEDKYLDIQQIYDEITMVMPDDMTGPCSSPDKHAGEDIANEPGDELTDEYSEDAEVVSEFEQDVSFLLDGFVLEANYTEVRVPELPSEFCSEEDRDSFSRTIFHFEKQVTGNIREAMKLYDRAVQVKYENLNSVSPYPADHPVHREALMRIEVVIAGAQADIAYWRSVRKSLGQLSMALDTVPIVDCDKSAMDDHGYVPMEDQAPSQNASVRPQPTLDALRNAINNAPNAQNAKAVVLPQDTADDYGAVDAAGRADDAIIRMQDVQRQLETRSARNAQRGSYQSVTSTDKPTVTNGTAKNAGTVKKQTAVVRKTDAPSQNKKAAQTLASKGKTSVNAAKTVVVQQNRSGSKKAAGQNAKPAQVGKRGTTPNFSPLNVALPKKAPAQPVKTPTTVKKVEVPNTVKSTGKTFTATFPDARPTAPKNMPDQMTAVKAPPLVVNDYLGNPIRNGQRTESKPETNTVAQ